MWDRSHMHNIKVSYPDIFKACSDETRLRILRLLANHANEMCSCEIVDSLLEPEYKISRHLKVLKSTGLITAVKDGKWVYHGLVKNQKFLTQLQDVVSILPDIEGKFKKDYLRFKKRMKLRSKGRCVTGAQYNEEHQKAL